MDASCGLALVCPVTMDKARAVTATFNGFAAANSLTVIKDGSGSEFGRVLSTPAGIDCGASGGNRNCANSFTGGQSVTLVASIPDANSGTAFAGWEVYLGNNAVPEPNMCTGAEPTCQITMTGVAVTVRARFERGYILTLQNHGNGQGNIIANAGHLQTICFDTMCSQTYNFNQTVTLTANPGSGSAFRGWQGACSGFNPVCTVTMNQARLVTAIFDQTISGQLSMMVIKEGSGSAEGRVVAVPEEGGDGIDCASNNSRDCSGLFQAGRGVTLTATVPNENTGAYFSRWQIYFWDPVNLIWVLQKDMCTGLEPVCHVTMTSEVQVRAMFDIGFILTVVRNGTGTGSVVTNVPELDACTIDSPKSICSQTFNSNRRVTLIAVAELGSRFIGWNSCERTEDRNGDGVNETCLVTMSTAKLVTATFDEIDSARLTILKDTNSTGSGVIKSEPLGIDCGEVCIRNFELGTQVKLTAMPAEGSEFVGWGGDWCAGSEPVCVVSMDKAKIVTARFDRGFRLTVEKQGSGAGRIVSQPQGIDCGATCAFSFTNNATVTLTVRPDEGTTFLGWGGACSASGTALTCTLPMTQSRKVIATFSDRVLGKALDNQQLNWLSGGDAAWFAQDWLYYFGDASVRSGGISHGQQSWIQTTLVGPGRLTFYWAVSSEVDRDALIFETSFGQFAQISGDINWQQRTYDIPAGTHVVRWTYRKDNDVTHGLDFAGLDRVEYLHGAILTVNQTGNGFGTVVSNPRGIDCLDRCSAGFQTGTLVTLTANALDGSNFVGWGGVCSGSNPTCTVTMADARNVTATFNWTAGLAGHWATELGRLNDTGIDWCANNATHYLANREAWCADLSVTHPNQDAHVGRDVAVRRGSINKIGGGSAGFDYTRICNSGEAAGQGQCPQQPPLGTGPNEWGCTRDNVTGLIWEVKTVGGLRDKDRVSSWYNPDDRTNGGSKGDNCIAENCNTARYVDSINRLGLCGANDWRLPTRQELHSLVHHGRTQPAIDSAYFPNTSAQSFWTSTPTANFAFNSAWYVHFESGWDYWDNKSNKHRVRLVRTCEDCRVISGFPNPRFANNKLQLPVVNVGGRFYRVTLRVVNEEPLTFELTHAEDLAVPIGRSTEIESWPRYHVDKRLAILGGVEVGSDTYNAALQEVPGSQPLRFVLSAARKLQ